MNVQTVMRMAAAGGGYDPAEWVQVRLSMMDTVAPWRDLDGVFVSLVEDATGWTLTTNYNGAGGINDGISEMVAWKSAGLGNVIPDRAGLIMDDLNYAEFLTVINALPADATAWRPVACVGALWDANATLSLGIGFNTNNTTTAFYGALNQTSGTYTSASTEFATYGWILPNVNRPGFAQAGAYTKATGAFPGNISVIQSNSSTHTVASNSIVVAFGNAVNNPVAGNRTISVRFWTRIFDLPNLDPWVTLGRWNVISPADFGSPTTPTSDPNALLSAFDTTNYPEWRPTINNTGKAGPFDGLNEGVRWQWTPPAEFPLATEPILILTYATQIPTYADTYSIGAGFGIYAPTAPAGASGVGSGFQGFPTSRYNPQGVIGVANDFTNNSLNFPTGSTASRGFHWMGVNAGAAKYLGAYIVQAIDNAPLAIVGSNATSNRSNTIQPTSPIKLCAFCNLDLATTVGTGSAELRFYGWWATVEGWYWDWPV